MAKFSANEDQRPLAVHEYLGNELLDHCRSIHSNDRLTSEDTGEAMGACGDRGLYNSAIPVLRFHNAVYSRLFLLANPDGLWDSHAPTLQLPQIPFFTIPAYQARRIM